MFNVRDKVYPYGQEGGRSATVLVRPSPVELPGTVDFYRQEDWVPMPREVLPVALELFEVQRKRFHNEAGKIQLWLDGP